MVVIFFDNRIKVFDGPCELTYFEIGDTAVEMGAERMITFFQSYGKRPDTAHKISTQNAFCPCLNVFVVVMTHLHLEKFLVMLSTKKYNHKIWSYK